MLRHERIGAHRRQAARRVRHAATELAAARQHPEHRGNGDEATYESAGFFATYTKGLDHDPGTGLVLPDAYARLRKALDSGEPDDFDVIFDLPAGTSRTRLVNPQSALAFDLEGPDAAAVTIPPAPPLASARAAAEMVELYAMALVRDVPFRDFATLQGTVDLLTALSDCPGNRPVTTASLFRGPTPGDLAGPYVSQFLYRPVPIGTLLLAQRSRRGADGEDFLTDVEQWRRVQDGLAPTAPTVLLPGRLIVTPRDLASYDHFDFSYQAFLHAALILLNAATPAATDAPQPLDPAAPPPPYDFGNPYTRSTQPRTSPASPTQAGFVTFGGPHLLTLVAEVATRALKAAWYQKWYVHRRLRPEAFGRLVADEVDRPGTYPLHPDLTGSAVLGQVAERWGSRLLPQAYPEGSPLHPAYPSGHGTVAGACTTVLKAFFDESQPLADPVEPDPDDDLALRPYAGTDVLTVGGELDKLASNIGLGRNFAGVHYWSDHVEGLRLGEQVAIGLLQEQAATYNEEHSFTLRRFDQTALTIP